MFLDLFKYIMVFLACFVLLVVILNAFIGFVDIFFIYVHILKIFLHLLKSVKKCEQFSYDFVLCDWS